VLAVALGSLAALSGLVDVYWGYNLNQPEVGDNFFAGAGTTALRANQIAVNLAALGVTREPEPVGFRLVLIAGTGASVLHAAEPGGAVERRIWDHVGEAAVSWKPHEVLRLDAGVLRAPSGFESFYSVENWSYTRGWIGEMQPYIEAGARAVATLGSGVSAEFHVMNGWGTIGDVNEGKTLAVKVGWGSPCAKVAFTALGGPEQRDVDLDWRWFGDLVAWGRVHERVELAANVDGAVEQIDGGGTVSWHAAAAYARVQAAPWLWLALRAEYFHDPDGHITGTVQTLGEGTVTAEARPHPSMILKLEARYDRSTSAVFSATDTTPVVPELTRDQLLFVTSAAAVF
jgi:hypothetical protein